MCDHRVPECRPIAFRSPATAPTTYSAYTGTDAKQIPHAPALGPANSIIQDPTFGSRILRVTDAHTNGGDSLIPEYAGYFRTWNANSTALKLHGPHGTSYWLEFDVLKFQGRGWVCPANLASPELQREMGMVRR